MIQVFKYVYNKIRYKKDVEWLPIETTNSLQGTNMTQKLTAVGHGTAFNNEQSLHSIVKMMDITQSK